MQLAVFTPNGQQLMVTIPPGMNPGQRFPVVMKQ
jgi:hypothetical protein